MASPFSSSVKGLNSLRAAALDGDIELLKKVVGDGDEGKFAKIRDFEGCTELHIAAGAGNTHICKYMITKLNFDVNDQDKNGFTPLHYAIMRKHIPTAVYLIDEGGSSIAKTTNAGFTPLHFAAWTGGKELLQPLISRGLDIEAESDGGTPLACAAFTGNKDGVEFLLQNKANPNPVNSFNSPILMSAKVSLACTDLLVKGGADPNIIFCGETPLHSAVIGSKDEIIMYLLKAGANPNISNYMGLTPLELAAFCCNLKAMSILFPVTTTIPSIQDWSIQGIKKYFNSKQAKEKVALMKKRSFHIAKSKGKDAFNREEYWEALSWYLRANALDRSDATVFANKSLCYANLDRGFSALSDAKECVRLKPDWAKAHFREGVAWKLLKEYNHAAKSFSRALKITPNNLEIQEALREAIEANIESMGV